jgi:hypothetical protein
MASSPFKQTTDNSLSRSRSQPSTLEHEDRRDDLKLVSTLNLSTRSSDLVTGIPILGSACSLEDLLALPLYLVCQTGRDVTQRFSSSFVANTFAPDGSVCERGSIMIGLMIACYSFVGEVMMVLFECESMLQDWKPFSGQGDCFDCDGHTSTLEILTASIMIAFLTYCVLKTGALNGRGEKILKNMRVSSCA